MTLSTAQLQQAHDWINQQFGGNFGTNGQFNPGGYQFDPNNTMVNTAILGAANGMNYGAGDVSDVLHTFGNNIDPSAISAYADQYAPLVQSQRAGFDAGAFDPAAGQDPFYSQGAGSTAGGGNPAAGSPTVSPPAVGAQSWGPDWSTGGYGTYTASPYMNGIISDLTTQSNNNLTRNILPGIRQDSVAMGGVGGSKEGIAQGLATSEAQRNLDGVIANTMNTDYQNSQNRNLTRYGVDTNADLTGRGQDMNFYTQQRGQDQSGAVIGANIYNMAQQGGWAPFTTAGNIYSQFSGLGNSTTGQTQQGGGATGAIGGALGGAQLWNMLNGNNSNRSGSTTSPTGWWS